MGSWSENCAVSGMEIKEGDECYVALVVPHKYGEDQPVVYVPPIKGVYADYGSIDLLESNTRFGLVKGENWSPQDVSRDSEDNDDYDDALEEHENPAAVMKGRPLYIQGSVFEFLPNLIPEYPYYKSDKVKNIGEIRDRALVSLREKLDESIEMSNAYREMDDADDRLMPMYLGNVFGIGNDIQANMESYAGDIIRDGAKDFTEMFEYYGRSLILIRGLSELRKIAVPGIRGPQHDGEIALIQFYQFVLDTAKARKAERDARQALEDAEFDNN